MSEIKGIFAASMSIFRENLTLDLNKTVFHAENLINKGCHGVAIFGSTGQAQLIPISEKINLLNKLSVSKYKEKYIIGTGLNSLGETINLSFHLQKLAALDLYFQKLQHHDNLDRLNFQHVKPFYLYLNLNFHLK